MNRTELVADIAERADVSKAQAGAVLDALADSLVAVVGKGEKVQVPGVFTVQRVERSARTGRNPQTGEPLEIAAGFSVKMTPGSRLKDSVSA